MSRQNGDIPLGGRHGSESSTNSWHSQSTVREDDCQRGVRNGNGNTNGRGISPHSTVAKSSSRRHHAPREAPPDHHNTGLPDSPQISPTDQRKLSGLKPHRKALAVLGTDDYFSPGIQPTAPPQQTAPYSGNYLSLNPIAHDPLAASWAPTTPSALNGGTFLNDSSEQESPVIPTFRTDIGRTALSDAPDSGYDGDHRRPSAASATTVSSSGSKNSQNGMFRKRLHGLFGDDSQGSDSRHGSDSSLQRLGSREQQGPRGRNDSISSRHVSEKGGNGASSPNPSRPRTPIPSSDVAPWVYQRFNDISQHGDAPIRQVPTGPDSRRYATNSSGASSATTSQKESKKLPFPPHRHSRSKEGKPTSSGGSGESAYYSSRPASGRDDVDANLRLHDAGGLLTSTAMSSTSTLGGGRSASPTPSTKSALMNRGDNGQEFPGVPPNKHGFLDKFRRHKAPSALKNLPGSTKSLQDPFKGAAKMAKRELSPARRRRQGSFDSIINHPKDSFENERKNGKGMPSKFRGRRGFSNDVLQGGKNQPEQEGIWALDTDLDHMEGIISEPRPFSPTDQGGIFDGDTPDVETKDGLPIGNWDAPESWQVKRPGDDLVRALPEIDDEIEAAVQNDGLMYFIRVFRIDSTFATLSAPINATVADILVLLGKKSFLHDHLNNYEIVMRKNDLSRQLDHGERPILMQKRLLEQVGYKPWDKIEDIGREDHSYLCRFIFLSTKLSGYASLENDPGFNKSQKFSHVDLQGRSLVTIPITLYKKAPEIISLNLSRNLSLDVPSDFIQCCINLREIKFMSNEAWRLPPSISLATRLTYLDVSNNRLEQLTYANLDRLQGLVSIKMANNKLSSLPTYFGDFSSLRSLNLSSNSFEVFPEFLCNLPSLVDLDISFNSIRELPKIGRLRTLERLWANNNMLSGPLDPSFHDLTSIKEIDARFNSITKVDSVMQLPRLEKLLLGHNAVTKFRGSFPKLRTLVLDHCPITQFDLDNPILTLTSLNIASAKLVQFKDSIFDYLPNLSQLILDKNHFSSLSQHVGKLRRLEHFSMIKNPLSSLPPTIGCLQELKYLNLRECNLNKLPSEVWYCRKLETLNVSSNILDSFPKYMGQSPLAPGEYQPNNTPASTPGLSNSTSYENIGPLDDASTRRPSQASGELLSIGSSPASSVRKDSVVSNYTQGARKASTPSRTHTEVNSATRKDSNSAQRAATTFSGSMRNLYIADNRLEDDIYRELSLLPELRVLNLSYNELTELPQGCLKCWPSLSDLYLSGNELTSLPSDDLEETSNLKTLHINANRFQVLPAELCKVSKLSILDVGSNSLKYNVSNWPYDWNWNWNHNLKYLNFSGNKRMEIKRNIASFGPVTVNETDLTDFNSLPHLRILGLMDVTLTIKTIPEETEDRRVRTSASLAGSLAYGMADFLGKNEHLSIIDMMVPRLRTDNLDTLVGLFDGQSQSSGGSKIAKFLHENFTHYFTDELKRLQSETETPLDALRRTFLALNKDIAGAAYKSIDDREVRQYIRGSAAAKLLNHDDIHSGGIATVLYLRNMELYVANVGDAQAVLVKSDGSRKILTFGHDPAESHERARICAAGGFVSRNGKLNDILPVSRAFGYFQLMPSVIAEPHTAHFTLTEQDEMVIMASREVWDYVTPDLVVDVARAERRDLMIASQKIRDLAIAFGASEKLMVMILGVSELKKRERFKFRGTSLSMGPSAFPEEGIVPSVKRTRRPRDGPGDSRLARFDYVDAPVGELAIIFTDIKKSTALWEMCPNAMRSAIQIHNDILRRQLGIVGGYEVKTEGDAFMVAFSTTTAALLWCFNCQQQLLEAEWPTEILEQPQCKEWYDQDDNLIFRGLSVRMGIHWGEPVCEKDPITNRMDYFGPMVNRASRISAVADGGQLFVSSDFMNELSRTIEMYADSDRAPSIGSASEYLGDPVQSVRRELQQLHSQGFLIDDQGERKLKGLENPEPVYWVYPVSLSGRVAILKGMHPDDDLAPATMARHSQLGIDTDHIWSLWDITLRLESLCSTLETPGQSNLNIPNKALFNALKKGGGELADSAILGLVDMQVTRIESCVNTLVLRHMMHPFKLGDTLEDHTIPMGEVLLQLQTQLAEFKALKKQLSVGFPQVAPDPVAQIAVHVTVPTPKRGRSRHHSSSLSSSSSSSGSERRRHSHSRDRDRRSQDTNREGCSFERSCSPEP